MTAGDVTTLTTVFDGMSAEDRAHRYLTPMPHLPGNVASQLIDLTDCQHVAWVAAVEGVPVGISRFIRVGTDMAEVAVEVVTAAQRQGIATILLALTRCSAMACGIRTITAVAQPSNRAVVSLLKKSGIRYRVDAGLIDAMAPLPGGIPAPKGRGRS